MKFKVKGLKQDIDFDVTSFSLIDEVESYNINTGEACILFEIHLTDGTSTMLGVDLNIKNLSKNQIATAAEKLLLDEFEEKAPTRMGVNSNNNSTKTHAVKEFKLVKFIKNSWFVRFINWIKNLFKK
jgi:hypothetical protein